MFKRPLAFALLCGVSGAALAEPAGAREAVEVKGASHVVMLSHPHEVAAMIERAAASR